MVKNIFSTWRKQKHIVKEYLEDAEVEAENRANESLTSQVFEVVLFCPGSLRLQLVLVVEEMDGT